MQVNKNSVETDRAGSVMTPDQILKTATTDMLRDLDLTSDELFYLLDLAGDVKRSPGSYGHALEGKSIALLFEKPSLRTKLTFEIAMKQLGGGFGVYRRTDRRPRAAEGCGPESGSMGQRDRGPRFRSVHRGGSGALVLGAGDQCPERRL